MVGLGSGFLQAMLGVWARGLDAGLSSARNCRMLLELGSAKHGRGLNISPERNSNPTAPQRTRTQTPLSHGT
eukprot:10456763-Alexandrium_andersonii.AAC.1